MFCSKNSVAKWRANWSFLKKTHLFNSEMVIVNSIILCDNDLRRLKVVTKKEKLKKWICKFQKEKGCYCKFP